MTTLKVIYPDAFPMVNKRCHTVHESSWCRMPGLAVEIIDLISKHMNITVETVNYDSSINILKVFDANKEFTGFYSFLENGSTDLIASATEPLELRKGVWDFTLPLYQSETRIAVRKPDKTLSSVFDFFNVYGSYTWMLMLITFVVFTLFGLVVLNVEKRMGLRSEVNGYSLIWKMYRLQIVQPSEIIYKLSSGNLALIIFGFLQCSIVVSLYQSWILTSVVRQRKSAPFNTDNMNKALRSGMYYLVTAMPSAWYYEQIENSYQEPFFSLGRALKQRGVQQLDTVEESFKAAETDNAIVIVQNDQYDGHIVSDFCELETVLSPFPPMNESFMIRKNHPLLPRINEAIEAQQVLIQRVFRKYVEYRLPSKCSSRERKIRALSLTPYLGVLLLLAIGLSISCFAFVVELIFGQNREEEDYHEHYS